MASKKMELLLSQLTFLQENGGSAEAIAELEEKISKSKKGKRSKTKGAGFEAKNVKKLNSRFPVLDIVRVPQSGGFNKSSTNSELRGDITNANREFDFLLHIECKNQITWKLKEWLKQAMDDCPSGRFPCVIFHQEQKNEEGKRVQEAEDFICLRLDDFLEIVDDSKVVKKIVTKKVRVKKNEGK